MNNAFMRQRVGIFIHCTPNVGHHSQRAHTSHRRRRLSHIQFTMTLPPTLTAFLAVIVLITIQPLISFSLSDIDTDDAVSALAIASTSPTFESGRLLSHRDVDTNSARRGVALEWQNLLLIPEESR